MGKNIIMTIESMTFRGTMPPKDYSSNESVAAANLNNWRNKNLNASIINIETITVMDHVPRFEAFRVWFEVPSA